MLQSIKIKNVASYNSNGISITDLKKSTLYMELMEAVKRP